MTTAIENIINSFRQYRHPTTPIPVVPPGFSGTSGTSTYSGFGPNGFGPPNVTNVPSTFEDHFCEALKLLEEEELEMPVKDKYMFAVQWAIGKMLERNSNNPQPFAYVPTQYQTPTYTTSGTAYGQYIAPTITTLNPTTFQASTTQNGTTV